MLFCSWHTTKVDVKRRQVVLPYPSAEEAGTVSWRIDALCETHFHIKITSKVLHKIYIETHVNFMQNFWRELYFNYMYPWYLCVKQDPIFGGLTCATFWAVWYTGGLLPQKFINLCCVLAFRGLSNDVGCRKIPWGSVQWKSSQFSWVCFNFLPEQFVCVFISLLRQELLNTIVTSSSRVCCFYCPGSDQAGDLLARSSH